MAPRHTATSSSSSSSGDQSSLFSVTQQLQQSTSQSTRQSATTNNLLVSTNTQRNTRKRVVPTTTRLRNNGISPSSNSSLPSSLNNSVTSDPTSSSSSYIQDQPSTTHPSRKRLRTQRLQQTGFTGSTITRQSTATVTPRQQQNTHSSRLQQQTHSTSSLLSAASSIQSERRSGGFSTRHRTPVVLASIAPELPARTSLRRKRRFSGTQSPSTSSSSNQQTSPHHNHHHTGVSPSVNRKKQKRQQETLPAMSNKDNTGGSAHNKTGDSQNNTSSSDRPQENRSTANRHMDGNHSFDNKQQQEVESTERSPVTSALSALEGLLAAAFGGGKPNVTNDRSNEEELSDDHDDGADGPLDRNQAASTSSTSHRQLAALSSFFNSVVNSNGGDNFMPEIFNQRFSGGSRWTSKASGLESPDPEKQSATLADLSDWLSYANEDSIGGFPTERVVKALIDILAGRRSTFTVTKKLSDRSRRRINSNRRRYCEEGEDDDWVDMPSVVFGTEEAVDKKGGDDKVEADEVLENNGTVKTEKTCKKKANTQLSSRSVPASSESSTAKKIPRAVEVFSKLFDQAEQESDEHHDEEGEGEEEAEEEVEEEAEEDGQSSSIFIDGENTTDGIPVLLFEDPFKQATRKVTAANCLHMLLDVAPQSARTVAGDDGIRVLCGQLQQIEYIDLAERIVLVLQQLASETPNRLLEQGGLQAMLEFVEFFPIAVQRTVVKASCALLSHIESKKEYQMLIKNNLTQIGALLLREDEQILQTVCQSFHRLVDFIARENTTSTGFAKEAFDEMTSQGIIGNFVSLMKRAVMITGQSNGELPLVNGYLFSLESLYILSVFAFYSDDASQKLLELRIFELLIELFGLQSVPGQDSLLTLRGLGLVTSLLPVVLLAPVGELSDGWVMHHLIRAESKRAEIFRPREADILVLCKNFSQLLLQSLRLPTGGETLRLSLTYFVSLTSLVRFLSPTTVCDPSSEKYSSSLASGFLESLDTTSLASFLYSVLAASTGSIVPHPSKEGASSDHRTSLTTTLASLLIISSVIEFQPNRSTSVWHRYGILDIVKHLSYIELFSRQSGRRVLSPLGLTTQLDLMTKTEASNWAAIKSMFFASDVFSSILVNVSMAIRWAACRLGCALLSLSIGDTEVAQQEMLSLEDASPTAMTGRTILLPSLADKLLEAAENPSHKNEEIAQEALYQLRCLLLRSTADEAEEISAFELHDSGLIHALCKYLFGGCVGAPSLGSKNKIGSKNLETCIYEKRLVIFIKEICGISVKSLAFISNSWSSTGCLGYPADLRALLLLTRLCVGCMGQLERLPFRLHTLIPGAPSHSSSTVSASKHEGGCLPRHLHADHSLQRSVLSIARQQFGSGIVTDEQRRLVRHLEESVRRQRRRQEQMDVNERNVSSGVALTEGTHHHLQQYQLFKPHSLFGYLSREIKLYAHCEIGPIVRCMLTFPVFNEVGSVLPSNTAQNPTHDDGLKTEQIEKSDIGFFDRLQKLKKNSTSSGSLASIPEFKKAVIPDPRVAEDLLTFSNQTPEEQKITFVLQLSVDIRTTGSLLEQSLRGVIEKQIAIVEKKRRAKKKQRPCKTGKKMDTDDELGEQSDEDEISNDLSERSNQSISNLNLFPPSAMSEIKHLYISINGCTVPSHMTLCEALCRYSNALVVDRSFCSQESHSAAFRTNRIISNCQELDSIMASISSKRSTGNTALMTNHLDIHFNRKDDNDSQSPSTSSVDGDDNDTEVQNSNQTTAKNNELSESDLSGVWIATDHSRRLIISSSAEERSLAVEVKDSRSQRHSPVATPCISSENVSSRDAQIIADEDQTQNETVPAEVKNEVLRPLWGADHPLRIGVGCREPTYDVMKNSLRHFAELKGYFIREVKLEDVEEIYVDGLKNKKEVVLCKRKKSNNRNPDIKKIEKKSKRLNGQPLSKKSVVLTMLEIPDNASRSPDGDFVILSDGSRLICIASLLLYLYTKRSCQVLGYNMSRCNLNAKAPGCLNEDSTAVKRSNREISSLMNNLGGRPVEWGQRLLDLLKYFDISSFNSPLVCNSVKSRFTHLSLYRSLIEDTNALLNGKTKPRWIKKRDKVNRTKDSKLNDGVANHENSDSKVDDATNDRTSHTLDTYEDEKDKMIDEVDNNTGGNRDNDESTDGKDDNLRCNVEQSPITALLAILPSLSFNIHTLNKTAHSFDTEKSSLLLTVQQQMEYLRGQSTWIRKDLVMDAGTYPVVSISDVSCADDSEKLEKDDESEDDDDDDEDDDEEDDDDDEVPDDVVDDEEDDEIDYHPGDDDIDIDESNDVAVHDSGDVDDDNDDDVENDEIHNHANDDGPLCDGNDMGLLDEDENSQEDEDDEGDDDNDDTYVDMPDVEMPEFHHLSSHHKKKQKLNIKQPIQLSEQDFELSDVFENSEVFAKVFQIVLVLSHTVQLCISSNNCIATRDPKQFLIDHRKSQSDTLDVVTPLQNQPLYFPAYSQLRAALASPVLTIKASRQLSDPIVIASAKLPRWISALPSIAPLLLPLDVRKTVLKSITGGSFVGLVSFKERIREIAEAIGAVQSSSSRSNFRFSSSRPSSPSNPKSDPLLDNGRPSYDAPDDFSEDFDGGRTDPIMLALAKEILGAEDTNKRKQLERLSDLEQALSPQRAKIRLARNQALASAAKVLDYFHLHNTSSSIPATMEIEYFEEEGVGSGPTLEFYSEVLDRLYTYDEPQLFRKENTSGCLFPQPYDTNSILVPPQLLRRPLGGRLTPTGLNNGPPPSQSYRPDPEANNRNNTSNSNFNNNDSHGNANAGTSSVFSSLPQATSESSSSLDPSLLNKESLKSENASARELNEDHASKPNTNLPMNQSPTTLSSTKQIEEPLFAHFKLLGQLFAKAVIDSRLIDIPLHPVFWSLVTSPVSQWPSMATEPSLAAVDPTLYRHMCQMRQLRDSGESLESLSVTFVLPGSSPEIELMPNGRQCIVDNDNLESFIHSVCEWTLWKGIALQVWAFRFGIATLMPLSSLSLFAPLELTSAVAGGVAATDKDEFWSLDHLRKSITADHGFTSSSPTFVHFLEVMNEFTSMQRRQFLKFCTGTTVLPHGGFAALKPPMKVVRKETPSGQPASSADETLPSVMACSNYVKLPSYSTKEKLKEKLLMALSEGQGAFTLS